MTLPTDLALWGGRFDLLAAHEHAYAALLSADERARAARLVAAEARTRFVLARGFLRTCLAICLDQPPEGIAFVYGERGKPALVQGGPAFNLAHSGDLLLLAITAAPAVGVDVEAVRPLPHLRTMAGDNFSAGEAAALFALPDAVREVAFFKIWTRKESFIKATGDGFRRPLASFDVSLDEPARLLRADGEEPAQWRLLHIEPLAGYVGAVCVPSGAAGTPPPTHWLSPVR